MYCAVKWYFFTGLRRDRSSYQQRGAQQKGLARFSGRMRTRGPGSQEIKSAPCPLGGSKVVSIALSPEELITRIMDAEPPEIYLMKEMKKPFTEANVMMSLTNLADKELVHMISWAKKIPGECITRLIRKTQSVITLDQCVTTFLLPKTQICLTANPHGQELVSHSINFSTKPAKLIHYGFPLEFLMRF